MKQYIAPTLWGNVVSEGKKPRHLLTFEERSRGGKKGGKTRASMPDFIEMCQYGYWCLQIKRPDVAMFIYETKVKPHMQKKAGAQDGQS